MDFEIRAGEEEHLEAVLALIKDLAEDERDQVTNSAELMKSEMEHFDFFVGLVESEVVGFALYFPSYNAWLGKSLHLENLYVKPAFREKGIASALMKEVAVAAVNKNRTFVRWQVLEENETAVSFYKNLHATTNNNLLICELNQKSLEAMASSNESRL